MGRKSTPKPPNSTPVGFRLDNGAHALYSSMADADRGRPVGTMLGIVLEAVQPIAALLEVDRTLTAGEILRRAGLDQEAAEAVLKFEQTAEVAQ